MKNIITNAADITVLRIIDNTLKTGGGPVSVGATAIRMPKGKVGLPFQVTADNWESLCGKPYPCNQKDMEGLRHLADAVKQCNYVNVVRVLPSAARFPALDVPSAGGAMIPATGGIAYGTDVSAGIGVLFRIYPVDGDPSVNRSVTVLNIQSYVGEMGYSPNYTVNKGDIFKANQGPCKDKYIRSDHVGAWNLASEMGPNYFPPIAPGSFVVHMGPVVSRFTLTITDKTADGTEYELESYTVGLSPDDVDDMGRSAYLPVVLEQNNSRFRVALNSSTTFATAKSGLLSSIKTVFTGGTNADSATITITEWTTGWDKFRNESYAANLMFAAGMADGPTLLNCVDIAAARHESFFFDVPATNTPDQAIAWMRDTGINNRQGNAYYCPVAANDQWYGGKTVWGASGAAAAACAIGDANMTGAVPGVHYAPAGERRGVLNRSGIVSTLASAINRDDFYTARINPIIAGSNGGAVIDDCLATSYLESYTRFTWVNRIANYIDHRFVQAAASQKFEPDGLTRDNLSRLTKVIMEDLVSSGALVPPRDVTQGTSPYVIVVTQPEIDLWLVTWDFCPTGAARRIAGQPRLFR